MMKKNIYNKIHVDRADSDQAKDLTGRDRMLSNVLWSWGGYVIMIVAGFILPRMIDRHIGQFSLGIWDFCWSLVSYLSLSSLGVGSSVNRYVAKYRASNNIDGLCKAVSSVFCIQLGVATFVILSTVALTWLLPYYFSDRLGHETKAAQWVVGTLGLSLAIRMALGTINGVMTGCHRWDLHNGINVSSHAVTVGGMIIALILGKGLRALGLITLGTTIITESIRIIMTYRICPELSIRLSFVRWSVSKEMLLFGWKAIIAGLVPLILVQTTNIFVVGTLGPAMLAVLSRSIALVRHVETIINKFAFIMTPTAGALQENGQLTELKQFFLDTTKYGVAILFPITLILVIFGDIIITLWMGSQYAHNGVLTILAIGYFLPTSQSSVMRILIGINLHGRIGLISLLVSLTVFVLGIIVVNATGWSLVNGALLIAIPFTIGNGIIVPVYACRQFNIPLMEYILYIFYVPFLCSLALGVILFFSRILFPDNMYAMLGFGSIVGCLVTGGLYWCFILPESFRMKIRHILYRYFPVLKNGKNA